MKRMMLVLLACLPGMMALAADPFKVVFRQFSEGASNLVAVAVTVPQGNHVYAGEIEAKLEPGGVLPVLRGDQPVPIKDTVTGTERPAFSRDFTLTYDIGATPVAGTVLDFSYQGCNDKECFFPQTRSFPLQAQAPGASLPAAVPDPVAGWKELTRSHEVAATGSGYMRVDDFLAFLGRAEGRGSDTGAGRGSWVARIKAGFILFGSNPGEFLKIHGAWWTVIVILMGGLLLNLTPCVLPMIPINLAILGVGSQDSSRSRGLLLGGLYGLGIALVYGVLGLVVVLSGSQFGTLNSLPWFNAVIGIVFVVLALAMFDVFSIDFARFQPAGAGAPGRGPIATALVMGGVAALLAGACVAPVVIAVLLLSGSLYAQGAAVGLALPFILGLGMALPWPLAGAGLTFLPKPGKWMNWVKAAFGVFILLFALYYFFLAYQGWSGAAPLQAPKAGVAAITASDQAKWTDVLQESVRTGKPVWVDFWATWCKNCEAMELTTFRDDEVSRRLSDFLVVKFQAEKPAEPATRAALDFFGVKGLPTYVVLKPVVDGDAGHGR